MDREPHSDGLKEEIERRVAPVLRRARKPFRRLITTLALIFFAAYTGVFFELNDRRLGSLISSLVTHSVRGRFTIGRAHYDYFGGLWSILSNTPTHVTGGDFEMIDPDGNVVMRVPHVEAEAHLRELIGSLLHFAVSRHFHVRLHFASATIPGGFAVIAPTRSSFGTQKPEMNIVATMTGKKPATDDRSELSIAVDDATIGPIDLALASSNPQGQLSWIGRIEGARAHARLTYSSSKRRATPEGPAFFFAVRDIDVERGSLNLGDFAFPLSKLHADYFGTIGGGKTGWGPRQELAFSARATSYDGGVQATGAMLDPYGARTGVRMKLQLEHALGLAQLLPDPIASWVKGDPHGTLSIEGPFASLVIGGELDGAEVDLYGLHLKNAGGRMRFLDGGFLRLEQLHGEIGRGRVRGKVDVRLADPGSWSADIDASNVDPAAVPPIPPSLRPLLAGRFAGRVRLGGGLGGGPRASAIDVDVTSSTLERSANDALPRHLDLAGSITWRGDRLALKKVALHGDGVTVDATGAVAIGAHPSAALDFTLSAVHGPWLARVGLPGDLQIDRAVARGHLGGPLLQLEGGAKLELESLVVKGRRIDHATASLSLARGRLRIDDLVGEGVGAALSGHGAFRLFETDRAGRTQLDRLLPQPEIDASLKADGANLSEVFGTVGVAGKGALDVLLTGPLGHPDGHAAVTVPELTLLGDRYREGRLAFDFSHEGAKVTALRLTRVDGGQLEGTGGVGWNGALDLDLRPRSFPLAAIPGVSTLPVSILGTLSGNVHLGGDLLHPIPGGIISLVGAKIRETLFGDGSLKLEPGADAIHVTGTFFESFSVDGYLTLYPKLSVSVNVAFKDIDLTRMFPELRKLAEVHGRATGEARVTADADGGLTFAGLRLSDLSLVLAGGDETGHARRLVVRNQEEVTLSTNGIELLVDRCYLRSALGTFSIHGRLSQHDTDVKLKGQIGLELMEYFFTSFFQHTHGDASVDLTVKGDLATHPTLLGNLDLSHAILQPRGLENHTLSVPSGRVEFEPDAVILRKLQMELDGAVAQASGRIALVGYSPGAIEGDVSGELSTKLLQWVLPDQVDDASGRVGTNVHLGGTWQRPEWRGDMQIRNVRFLLRRTGREVAVNEGTLRLRNYDIAIGCVDDSDRSTCKNIVGAVDDESHFTIEGKVGFGEHLALRALALHLEANDLSYAGGDVAVQASPNIDISGDGRHLALSGLVNIVEGRYTLDFDLLGTLLKPKRSIERAEPFWVGIPVLEQMALDLKVRTTGPFLVRNNIADFTFSTDLHIGGTVDDPAIGGAATIDQGGTISLLTLCRFPFQTNRSQITFDPEKRYPETPSLQISATGVLVSDRSDSSQNVNIQITGPIGSPQSVLSTQQGVQGSDVVMMCLTGRTAEELRRSLSPASATGGLARSPAIGGVQGNTATEGVVKSASSTVFSTAIDPLRKVVRLDTLSLELGSGGVDLRACKRITRGLKTCGQGEFGFVSGTRVGGYAEYRISDQFSVLGRGEYLTRGADTIQDSLTRGRLELNYKLPVIW